MTTKATVVLVCDLCDGEDEVGTHTVALDGQTVEVEVCERQWAAIEKRLSKVFETGRKVPRQKRRKRV